MKASRKILFITIVICSMVASSEAMSAECSIFNGVWKDKGKGVIAYLGNGKVVLYNGNQNPSSGECLSSNKVQVTFQPSGNTHVGEIRSDVNLINWSNGSIWQRVSGSVNFPNDIPQ